MIGKSNSIRSHGQRSAVSVTKYVCYAYKTNWTDKNFNSELVLISSGFNRGT